MLATKAADACEKAQAALQASPVLALRKLRVDRAERSLTIRGQVASYYHKQLAQEVVRSQALGWTIVNSVVVSQIADD